MRRHSLTQRVKTFRTPPLPPFTSVLAAAPQDHLVTGDYHGKLAVARPQYRGFCGALRPGPGLTIGAREGARWPIGGPRVGVVGSLHAPRGWRILYTSRFRGAELGESRALKKSRQRWEPVMGWGGAEHSRWLCLFVGSPPPY